MIGAISHQKITSISQQTRDGWGDITSHVVYQNVPTKFSFALDRNLLSDSEKDVVVAICYLTSQYTVKQNDKYVIDNEDYLVHRYEKLYDFFGNIEGYKVFLKSR